MNFGSREKIRIISKEEGANLPIMLSQSDLQHLIDHFDDPSVLHGLLLHGSCAKGSDDAASDIDLICVKRADELERKQSRFLERKVDLYISPPDLIRRAFAKPRPDNNNVILNAFMAGHILAERDDVVSHLARDARVIWQNGPPPISPAQQTRRVGRLTKGLEQSKKTSSRGELSHLSTELAKLLADSVFREAVAVYCRVNRRWASSLPETLQWFRRDDPRFYERCEHYLLSQDLAQRVARLERVIGTLVATEPASALD